MPKLSPLIISMLLFGGVMLGIQSYYAGVQSVYSPGGELNSTIFKDYESIMNRTNQTLSQMEEHTAGFTNKKVTDLTKYYDATLIFLDVLAVIGEFPGMAISFANLSISYLPMTPAWFKLMLGSIIVAVFVMIIAAIATKRDEM